MAEASGIWNALLDQIKAQLVTQDDATEYLQGFTVYDYNDEDANDLVTTYPYVMVGYLDARDEELLSGETYAELDVGFVFTINSKTTITGVTESDGATLMVGDRLMGYILQEHKKFMQTMTLSTATVTVMNRGIARSVKNKSDDQSDDTVYEGIVLWPLKVLDVAL